MRKVLTNSARTLGTTIFLMLGGTLATTAQEAERRALFGDLHVHTRYSFDAFIFGTRTTPDDAYEFAKGKAIEHPGGFDLQLDRPLDFLAVTDHANYLGMLEAMSRPDHPLSKLDRAADFTQARTISEKRRAFRSGAYVREHRNLDVIRSAWKRTVEAAERHNDPGTFTTFSAYEYTSSRDGGNLHRNVIFKGRRGAGLSVRPHWTRSNPEDLWAWMDDLRSRGIEALAIPPQLEWLGRPHVPARELRRRADRRRLRRDQDAERAAGRGHPGQGHLRHAPFPVAERRVGGLRDHALPDRPVEQVEAARFLRPRRLPARAEAPGGKGRQPLPFRTRGSQRHAQRRSFPRRIELRRQGRHPGRDCRTARLRTGGFGGGRHGLQRHLLQDLERLRPRRRLGGGEHPGVDLRSVPPQGDLRHQRPADRRPFLRGCQYTDDLV